MLTRDKPKRGERAQTNRDKLPYHKDKSPKVK
jgi:hypothetical protein